MSDWYQENIEPEIRDFVKLLRDNGFNTEYSCGHEMYVECRYVPDGEVKRLHDLLYSRYKSYEITAKLICIEGCWSCHVSVDLKNLMGLKKEISRD